MAPVPARPVNVMVCFTVPVIVVAVVAPLRVSPIRLEQNVMVVVQMEKSQHLGLWLFSWCCRLPQYLALLCVLLNL